MIADYNTMPHMFSECNRLYFDHQLRTPNFGLMHSWLKVTPFLSNVSKTSSLSHLTFYIYNFAAFTDSFSYLCTQKPIKTLSI